MKQPRAKSPGLSVPRKKVKKTSVKINTRLCKQCGICIHFCPKKVLTEGDDSYPVVVDLEACTGCRLCELLCPDFAIEVEKDDEVPVG